MGSLIAANLDSEQSHPCRKVYKSTLHFFNKKGCGRIKGISACGKYMALRHLGKGKRAQVSVEYMMIIGFVTVIAVPLVYIYSSYTQRSTDEIISTQLLQIASNIADTSDEVFYLGSPTQKTFRIYLPDRVETAELNSTEVFFRARTSRGAYDIVQIASVNMTGSLPVRQGLYAITITAGDGNVQISYK